MNNNSIEIINNVDIKSMIYEIRGKQVMLDSDLASLYCCANGTKTVNLTVRRNVDRFPERFCFQLTQEEYDNLRFQIDMRFQNETASKRNKRYLPYVFTEQGIAMLATVLKTSVATEISIKIMDAFIDMRKFIINNASIFEKLIQHDLKFLENDKNIIKLFDSLQIKQDLKQKIFYEGQIYDAYSVLVDLVKMANKEIIIIDNYIDKSILDILSEKKNGVEVFVISKNNLQLPKTAVEKFNIQYPKVKINYSAKFHDRFIIIDNNLIYHLGASLKDVGKKCFAINTIEDKSLLEKIVRI